MFRYGFCAFTELTLSERKLRMQRTCAPSRWHAAARAACIVVKRCRQLTSATAEQLRRLPLGIALSPQRGTDGHQNLGVSFL